MEKLSCVWSGPESGIVQRHVCALANTEGGVLEVTGCPDGSVGALEDMLSFMGDGVRISGSGGTAEIAVAFSPYPVRFRGRFHSVFGGRVFDSTDQMEKELRKRAEKVYWLDRPYPKVSIDDLDWHAMESFRTMAASNGVTLYSELSDTEMLDSMNLLDEGVPTGTAVMLFHPEPERIVPGSFVRMS